MKKRAKIFLLLLFFCLLSWPSLGFASSTSPGVVTVKLETLQILNEALNKQEQVLIRALKQLNGQEKELAALKQELQAALEELQLSKSEILRLKKDLTQASESIENANQFLEKYKVEMEDKVVTAKRQRNLWFVGMIITGVLGGLK